jgi:hypothetical protein
MGVYFGFGIGITLLLKAHYVIEFMWGMNLISTDSTKNGRSKKI